MSLIIYFLRHGETTASQTGGYCGTLDPDLTPEGYLMAEDLKDKFRSFFGPQEPQKKKNALPHLVSKNEIVQGISPNCWAKPLRSRATHHTYSSHFARTAAYTDNEEHDVGRKASFGDMAGRKRMEKALKEGSATIRNKTGCHER